MSTNFLFSPTDQVLVLRGPDAELMPPITIPSMMEPRKDRPRKATPPKENCTKENPSEWPA
jgi:hypothetical protein